jgi:two-component system, NtrC family, nitrogen regulation response regulator NtrX
MILDTRRSTQPRTGAEQRSRPSWKVLLVDPNAGDLKYYASVLLGQGHEVRACASYDEGTLQLTRERFHLIIVNQGSRNFEGHVLVKRAIEVDRQLPVLVLTECLDMSSYLEAMQLGAVDYVEKPLRADEVARLVETHVRVAR